MQPQQHRNRPNDREIILNCPECGRLGWFRSKKTRSKPTSRYIERIYFYHKDDRTDHYIKQSTIQKIFPEYKLLTGIEDAKERMLHALEMNEKVVKTLPLTEEERHRWLVGCLKFMHDVIAPYRSMSTVMKKKVISEMTGIPLSEKLQQAFDDFQHFVKSGELGKWTDYNLVNHPYYQEQNYLHKKYQNDRIVERIKKRAITWKENYNRPLDTLHTDTPAAATPDDDKEITSSSISTNELI